MKKLILLLVLATQLVGCLNEGDAGCPADMRLSFVLDDKHIPGDYDTRIANEVLLYVFKDNKCVVKEIVSYADIESGKEYVVRKTDLISGNLDFVAWSVPANGGDPTLLPDWLLDDDLNSKQMNLTPKTKGTKNYESFLGELYLGVKFRVVEAIDVPTSHRIIMLHSTCRVEVNVIDGGGILNKPGAEPKVEVKGTMSQMDMNYKGVGDPALVHHNLMNPSDDKMNYTTGRFGVLPSEEGETVSVDIKNGTKLIATLNVPRENLPKGAEAGGLLIFDYTLGETEFWITINGFRVKIENVDGI